VCHPYEHPKYLNACSVRSMFMDQKGIWLSFFFFLSCLLLFKIIFKIIFIGFLSLVWDTLFAGLGS
jgi:hypothetical protein